jgi:hypothetical protein
MSAENPPKKKRRAPPGNTNALKLGCYSPRFGPASRRRYPQTLDPTGVVNQIDLLRVYIRHVKELSAQLENVHDQASLLHVLTQSMASLYRLMRIVRIISGSMDQKEIARAAIFKVSPDWSAECAARDPSDPSSAPPGHALASGS